MKFSHLLKFNTVPEWRDHYIHYAVLKKIIYAIAKSEADELQAGTEDAEYAPLAAHDKTEATEEHLISQLNLELSNIIRFYMEKETEILVKLEQLDFDVLSLEQRASGAPLSRSGSLPVREEGIAEEGHEPLPGVPEEDPFMSQPSFTQGAAVGGSIMEGRRPSLDLPGGLQRRGSLDLRGANARSSRIDMWQRGHQSMRLGNRAFMSDTSKLKQRMIDLYVGLHDLKNYLEYNKEGFRKILKKHDKLTSSNLKDRYWSIIEEKYPSGKAEGLDKQIAKLVEQYSVLFTQGNTEKAESILSNYLRDQIKVERNTVWRDMVAMERKTGTAAVVQKGPQLAGVIRPPFYQRHRQALLVSFSVGVFVLLLLAETFPGEPEKQNCLAMLVFLSILWVSEAIPLYATSMMVPPLVVFLRVLVDRTHPDSPARMPAEKAAPVIFHAMFSQTIMLLLGGFAIAGALSKHFIAKQMAIAVMSRVGRKPRNVILASMFVATFASMWISNVAAPVLTFSIVMPILKTVDSTNPFAKSMVMGIALASNIGGMTSPISSPQNIFAIERMSMDGEPPSWLSWFAVAIPVAIICNLLCWALIMTSYRPWTKVTDVRPLKPNTDPMTATQLYVIVISLLTVAIWCCSTILQPYIGEMGVVATLPLVAFFGFGVLDKDDFNGFLWNVVMLAMGGMALGEAVKSSGLLQAIAEGITIFTEGMDQYMVLLVFCALVLVCTTVISHTVGAMVILPIVQKVGEDMPGGHPKLLVFATALMCSGAMGLPVSGFPNMNARQLEDSTGANFVDTVDFLRVGIPGSVLAYFVIVSVGYILMNLVKL